jgi:hypothetical protein
MSQRAAGILPAFSARSLSAPCPGASPANLGWRSFACIQVVIPGESLHTSKDLEKIHEDYCERSLSDARRGYPLVACLRVLREL